MHSTSHVLQGNKNKQLQGSLPSVITHQCPTQNLRRWPHNEENLHIAPEKNCKECLMVQFRGLNSGFKLRVLKSGSLWKMETNNRLGSCGEFLCL